MKNNSDISFKIICSLEELIAAYNVRFTVFCEEQNIPYYIETAENELNRIHILGMQGKEPIAAGRMYVINGWLKFERIAVRKAWRSRRIGSKLVNYMVNTGKDMGIFKYKLHAQVSNKEFYKRLGFKTKGKIFIEAGIEHILMIRKDDTSEYLENKRSGK